MGVNLIQTKMINFNSFRKQHIYRYTQLEFQNNPNKSIQLRRGTNPQSVLYWNSQLLYLKTGETIDTNFYRHRRKRKLNAKE